MKLTEYAKAKALPLEFLKQLGLSEEKNNLKIPYFDQHGKPFRIRYRNQDKRWWGEGEGTLPYGLDRLDTGFYCCLCEGESDTQTLWLHDFRALGVPGASTFKGEWAEYLNLIPPSTS